MLLHGMVCVILPTNTKYTVHNHKLAQYEQAASCVS